jgi:hypothetical protein
LVALLVAVLSYKNSLLRPRLTLRIIPLQQETQEVQLSVDKTYRVPLTRPRNEWAISLGNDGKAAAKYPMVRMIFEFTSHDRPYFNKDAFAGWEAVLHAHGRGYYGFQWTPNDSVIVYPGFGIALPTIYFSGKYFKSDFVVKFIYVADGVSISTLQVPVKLNYLDWTDPTNKMMSSKIKKEPEK